MTLARSVALDSTPTACAKIRRGNCGTRTRVSLTPVKAGAVRSGYIPFNNLTTYQSPGSPKLNGTGYQLPAVPGNLIDPVAAKVMQNYPMPNISPGTTVLPTTSLPSPHPIRETQFGIKMDHSFSEKDRLSARFTRRLETRRVANVYGNALDPFSQGLQSYNAYQGVVNYTHMLNPKTLLNISLGIHCQSREERCRSAQYAVSEIRHIQRSGVP